ncbi:histone acetyltransferase p300 [Trichonephila clavipes]|nr:histone acetyltransferase p300 [Trichonephila clavipes]
MGSPHTNTIVIIAEIESIFVAKDDLVPFRCSPVSSCAGHHSKRRRRWVAVNGSTRNGRRDPKCPSARCIHMIREDTGAPNECATCAWMVADEAVGCTRAFLTM